MRLLCSLSLLFVSLTGFATETAAPVKGVDRSFMDTSVSPCDDFYAYANGAFAKVAIPGDHDAWGVNQEIDERTQTILRDILETCAVDKGATGTITQRLGDFYASGMDEAAIEKAGLDPLRPWLDEIETLKTPEHFARAFARFHSRGVSTGLGFWIQVDDKNTSSMIAAFGQGGLGLPERDYYFEKTEEAAEIRKAYVEHIAKMFALAGDKPRDAQRLAKAVMALETKLAKASRDIVALRDPEANYNRIERPALPYLNEFPYVNFLSELSFPVTERAVLVCQPEFLAALGKLLRVETTSTWRAYLRWHLLSQAAPYLSKAFVEEDFEFHGKRLSGTPEMQPRWKRVLGATDNALGEDLGQLYVKRAFSPAAKARVQAMVKHHLEAMRGIIKNSEWMSEETKLSAYKKIETMRSKVGYPDAWRNYSFLEIKPQPYVLNVFAASKFEFKRQFDKLGQPVDRDEWGMTPPTNNAYYDPSLNEMVFPAGILQPPFFDEKADDATNYGALASTIGHELTHGFDDEGRQRDWEGNLKSWWKEEDVKRFKERAQLVVEQYNTYEPLPGLHIDGEQTLGENIADIGGLRVSYEAWKLATKGMKQETVDGLTPDQRFFLAFAQGWRTNERPERIRLLVKSDYHSPVRARVIGPVSNFPEFKEAFGCPKPEKPVPQVW